MKLHEMVRVCSTPFGIGDRITRRENLPDSESGNVLNAFRHRRSDHCLDWRRCFSVARCSTPFGIGDRITTYPQSIFFSKIVLNAFRHRRSDHKHHHCAPRADHAVLNAFRHRRSDHFPQKFEHHYHGHVLNAFRHRRSDHTARRAGRS